MEDFAESLPGGGVQNQLLHAVQGKGYESHKEFRCLGKTGYIAKWSYD